MCKNIFFIFGIFWSVSGFSQKILNGYQAPQTVQDNTGVRMLPGFHANSNDGSYGSSSFIARIGDPSGSTNPPANIGNTNASSGENYVYERTYLVPVNSSNANAPQIQSITYYDGLGRPKQMVNLKATPTEKDLVVPFEYDEYGRQAKNFLPLPVSSLNANIHPISGDDVNTYYNNLYNNNQAGSINGYSENVYENSPLNRLQQSAFPGEHWKKDSNHAVHYDYDVNSTGEVIKKYIATTTWHANEQIYQSSVTNPENYASGTLYKQEVRDEDQNVQQVFKNSLGQVVLIRKKDGTINIDTYYVYDDYNRLAFIITPKAVSLNISQPSVVESLCYQYHYDEWGRLAEKKLPGKGKEYFAYDRFDRLVLSQDSEMKETGKWLFTKFDYLGRSAYTGITTAGDRKTVQASLNSSSAVESRNDSNSTTVNGILFYYSNQSFPTVITELLSVNYYDAYPAESPSAGTHILNQELLGGNFYNSDTSTLGMPTASYIKNIGEDKWTKNYIWYDIRGRAISSLSQNHLGGFTKTESELDFVGMPKKTRTYNSRNSASVPSVTIEENFTYDRQYRLIKHEHEVIGKSPKETLAEYTYNDFNQLIIKKVGGAAIPLQTVNYRYNIRGWLTDINDINNMVAENDLFAYKIRYNEQREGLEVPNTNYMDYKVKPLYNGNISEVDWKVMQDGYFPPQPDRYGYVYDGLSRLKAGFYQNPTNRSLKDNHEIIEEYDLNGNIKQLKRTGRKIKNNPPILIDDLHYTYDGNRLISIQDNPEGTPNPAGYEGGGGTIEYDQNGNMTVMPDKGITEINYNFLDLPDTIEKNGNTTRYTYRADGTKLKRVFTLNNISGSSTTHTDYLDGFHYAPLYDISMGRALQGTDDVTIQIRTAGEEEIFVDTYEETERLRANPGNPEHELAIGLRFFPTAEGFYDFRKKQYIYQYKDQIGNTRVSYWKDPEEGELKIIDRNDYYPFGMNTLSEAEFSATASPLNYKFQEQELQETGFYAFKWRQYMPDVGRFFNVDPLSEKYAYQSHYNFSENRVIDGRELEGLERVDIQWDGYNHDHGDFWNAINFNWSIDFSWGKNGDSDSSNSSSLHANITEIDLIPDGVATMDVPEPTWGDAIQQYRDSPPMPGYGTANGMNMMAKGVTDGALDLANFVRNVVFDKKDYNGLYPRMTDWSGFPMGGQEGQDMSVNALIFADGLMVGGMVPKTGGAFSELNVAKNGINQTSNAILKNGYYEVNGFKFSEYYYGKLWNTGRGAPSLVAKEVLEGGAKTAVPDAMKAGFNKYIYGGWEMIYNPTSKEVWHIQPTR
ncbi:MAG: DUF6443 domain-containing protein [Bergeyella sp.]